jgi:nucleotide-binding universal stress UspA family protein
MHLLVGIDGSDLAFKALDEVARRARETGDTFTVAVYSSGDRSLGAIEADVRDRLETVGVDASIERIETDPGGELIELTERDGHDRIVLPGGERSPVGKIQLDDTVEFVVLNARTSVTLVR